MIGKLRISASTLVLAAFLASNASGAYIANRDFLSVAQGARANAMGEAYSAVADDATAIFWNSAGLTQLQQDEFDASYADRFDGLSKEAQMHYARRGRKGMWGFAYAGSYVTDVPVTQSLTQADLDAIQTGAFAATDHPTKSVLDHSLLFSYSRPIQPESRHALGATVKLIYRDFLGMVHGYGTAIDVGYLYTSYSGTWRAGANVQNAASLVSYTGNIDNLGVRATATESYVPSIKTGLAYSPTWRVLNGRVLLAADVNMLTSFNVDSTNVGIEYSFGQIVALRAGKIFGRQSDSSQDYTLGMGIRLKTISLDFSFLSSELGQTSRGTIGYRLGGEYYTPQTYGSR